MTMRPDPGTGLTSAQETVQTSVLIIVSLATAWMLYKVPWQVSGDPCLLASEATVIMLFLLWLTRWWGLRGANLERNLLAAFLMGMPFVYVLRYLLEAKGHVASFWFWLEVLGIPVFAALAVLGLKSSPWFLAIGIVIHGLAWDSWHYGNSAYIPNWYALFCMGVDVAFGAYVAVRVPAYRRASRLETES